MLYQLKQYLAEKYLSTWIRQARFRLSQKEEELDMRISALEEAKARATITALTRAQLAGFNPGALSDRASDIIDLIERDDGTEGVTEFLRKVHDLTENPAFAKVAEYLIREQILHGQLEANSLESLNFSRATINGVTLFLEEVERLNGIHLDRSRREEDFDAHDVI